MNVKEYGSVKKSLLHLMEKKEENFYLKSTYISQNEILHVGMTSQ